MLKTSTSQRCQISHEDGELGSPLLSRTGTLPPHALIRKSNCTCERITRCATLRALLTDEINVALDVTAETGRNTAGSGSSLFSTIASDLTSVVDSGALATQIQNSSALTSVSVISAYWVEPTNYTLVTVLAPTSFPTPSPTHYCGPGTFLNVSRTPYVYEGCDACPVGKYSYPDDGDWVLECEDCPVGKHQASSGQPNCTECPTGRYESYTGAVYCTGCVAGRYNFNTRGSTSSSVCAICPAGRTPLLSAQLTCAAKISSLTTRPCLVWLQASTRRKLAAPPVEAVPEGNTTMTWPSIRATTTT